MDYATTVTFPNKNQIVVPFIANYYHHPSETEIEIHADSTYYVDFCNMVSEIPEVKLTVFNSKVIVTQNRKDFISRLNIDLCEGGKVESHNDLDIYKLKIDGKGTSITTSQQLKVTDTMKMYNNSEINMNAKENNIDEITLKDNCIINSDFALNINKVNCYENDKDTTQTINSDIIITKFLSYGPSKLSIGGIQLLKDAFLQCVCINGEINPLKVTNAKELNVVFCSDKDTDSAQKEALFDQLYLDNKNKFNIIESSSDIKINMIPNIGFDEFSEKEIAFFTTQYAFKLDHDGSLYTLTLTDTPLMYRMKYCFGGDINSTKCSLIPRFYSSEYNEDWKKQVKPYANQINLYFGENKEYTIDASGIKAQTALVIVAPVQVNLNIMASSETSIIALIFYGGNAKVDLNNFNNLIDQIGIQGAIVEFKNSQNLNKINIFKGISSKVSFDQKVSFSGETYAFQNTKITGDLDFSKCQSLRVDTKSLNVFDPNPQNLEIYLSKDVEKIDLQHGKIVFTMSNKENVAIRAKHDRMIDLFCMFLKEMTFSCSGTDELQLPKLNCTFLWKFKIVGEWPHTEFPLIFGETRIMDPETPININVKTDGAYPICLEYQFSGRNVYLDSDKDVTISYDLKPIEQGFYPFFYSSKNVYLKKIQLTDEGGIGYVTNTSNKFYIDEVDASGQSIELNNVEVRNMTMIKSSITGIYANFVDSYVTMNVPTNNQFLSTFTTNGKCDLKSFIINDDRHTLYTNTTEKIFCCSGGLSVKKLKTDTGNLHVKDKCIVFTPSISSSKLRLILLITIPCCALVLIVVVILIVFICKRSHKNKFETSTELTATLL
ncbi:hypothetical protein TVAG_491730 [Trichomonas vaginalis G3]|uniref:Uncharacterized protein n=1 Tax=Trichomonas vaginalis (strain ATCC PRA-98 / G3) TaxID=412133 RepID=A2EAK4_TRIV3|nr:hypothetical protein TVAGG3_1004400 [Trichomonas vaginalis G3]EAY10315.1 hypothetical protein TVAG_491730 [Trichomonas vaginalis G3]KAI5491032.1 hypothetical protein TVAGG3_1004400 [Trichomonas vaginalis G3]|eukprot:XP_001322538.1 hypothetical protein [Trichomonas vaginalis G3]